MENTSFPRSPIPRPTLSDGIQYMSMINGNSIREIKNSMIRMNACHLTRNVLWKNGHSYSEPTGVTWKKNMQTFQMKGKPP